jgi:WD40 repeat protein
LWEVQHAKDTGEFSKVVKVMELKGHKSAVLCVAFSSDSTKVATTSKDGTWKLWRINGIPHIELKI